MTTLLSIQEMAARSGLSRDTLRYYERVGLLSAVKRSGSGHRRYAEHDIAWVEFLLRLRATGMPIAAMSQFAELRARGNDSIPERLALLQAHRDKVLADIRVLQDNLAVIEQKIGHYSSVQSLTPYSRASRHEPANPGKPL